MSAGLALITGGSKGIGFAIGEELAKRGYDIVLVARSQAELQTACDKLQTHSIKATAFACDLSKHNAASAIHDWLKINNLQVNILVNNAGYGLWGSFEELTWKEQEEMVMVNVMNLLQLTHLLLPVLRQGSQSFILNVASTTAYQAIARLNVYAACKIFVLQFSRGLKRELSGTNVSVTCLVPGTTTTNFMDRAGMHSDDLRKKAAKFTMDASVVAKRAVDGMFKGEAEIIPGFTNWFSAKMISFLPKTLPEKIAAALYKK